ncbi:bifunctional EngB-type guanine nucleotide-binding (G) domain/P-loop containing nucleoside triphosphate hydrolase/GTP binding domain/GTP-binding protein [Babesia duncani]|uniref:Bifunctional EngB-type guanine nucleotide-binding (G) domain/P-loop containing nucleoside triphosphate hydrolase/GTP binding domain/GTP-binding protein n=1 Tax=Babesia duncani TaxID=323732 RepID=A0AAD9PKB4_9APIC|nr:bifunctional EngB-type guanine nucleotide-binding (G) domain/P-loop containing nucleoside triphosphate hydrolase/GTP binding domain/GTP-binding protein [Babesia duncani]
MLCCSYQFLVSRTNYTDICNLSDARIYASASTFSGPGRKVADRIKEQFGLSSDYEVRNVRRALKRYKRQEETRMIKARRNVLKSEYNIGQKKLVNEAGIGKNPYLHHLLPLEKVYKKNPLALTGMKKPIGINMSLDLAADLFGGSTAVRPTKGTIGNVFNLEFIGSYPHTSLMPSLCLPEICLIGRSNVGKSSLINVLMSYIRNKSTKCDAAFVSKTPGYTKCLNLFKVENRKGVGILTIVDLPGYGYAKTKDEALCKNMQSALKAYIQRRAELRLILFLVDGSISPQVMDIQVAQELKKMPIPHIVICTKMDKVNIKDAPLLLYNIRQALEVPKPLPFLYSKYGGGDLGTLWKAIFDACNDEYNVSKLQIKDIITEHESDPHIVKQGIGQITNKQLLRLVYDNLKHLPESMQGENFESKDRSQLLDLLNLAVERRRATEGQVPNLKDIKQGLSRL